MTWKTDCGTCRHACSQTVRIGDTAYGNCVEEQGCMMEDRMTDEEAERCDTDCPFWSPDLDVLKDTMAGYLVREYDSDEILENVCVYFGFKLSDIRKEAARRKRIKKVGDMLRDPDYHDIMVEMVHELEYEI